VQEGQTVRPSGRPAESPRSGGRAAFPIWRIAFYRHLDDRSVGGPIIDIGAFYRACTRGRGALTRVRTASRHAPHVPAYVGVNRKTRPMIYASSLIKPPPPVTINTSSYLISGPSSPVVWIQPAAREWRKRLSSHKLRGLSRKFTIRRASAAVLVRGDSAAMRVERHTAADAINQLRCRHNTTFTQARCRYRTGRPSVH